MKVGKCCNNEPKFLIVYQCGLNQTDKWLVCNHCSKDNEFQIYIKEKHEL